MRKIGGFTKPSKANEAAFALAVEEIAGAAGRFIRSLATTAPPRNRQAEAEKARARSRQRFSA